jgi:diphosphomevalonate decarboxylase
MRALARAERTEYVRGVKYVTARACANIALVKYWGKRDAHTGLNLPAAGSLSLTLDALVTTTTVGFDPVRAEDELVLDGRGAPADRVAPFLELVRERAGIRHRALVETQNAFPTGSGLASSASGFAALAVAAAAAAGLDLSPRDLSVLARQGSGSAARSIFGGFVRMHAGTAADGSDAFAEPIVERPDAGLAARVRMVVAIVGGGAPKRHSSRDAMTHSRATSPLHAAWLATVPGDLAAAEAAIAAGDLAALGAIAEASALAMHATAIAARPAILYWQPPTVAALDAVARLRDDEVPAWATIDAGPHVKVLTDSAHADGVARELRAVPGVTDVLISGAGSGAAIVEVTDG